MCGRDAHALFKFKWVRAPPARRRARRPRTQVLGMRAGHPRSQAQGETPALPGGAWFTHAARRLMPKPRRGFQALSEGFSPQSPYAGGDARAPRLGAGRPRSQEVRGSLMLPGARHPSPVGASRRSARASARSLRMRARRPRAQAWGEMPALPGGAGFTLAARRSMPKPRRGFQALSEGLWSFLARAGGLCLA